MQTLEWLKRLIAHDTTSAKSNLALLKDIEGWLSEHGITSHFTYDESHSKANLLATLPAANGDSHGGVVLSGHTDVVPVANQAWETDPFQAEVRDHKVYGRGACDMKGFIACVLASVPIFKKLKLTKPVHFAFTYDEEIGCLGAPSLIAQLQELKLNPEACIVGEPSKMQAIVAHKGIQLFRCALKGKATHSSLTPSGCNAIEYAADFITYLRRIATECRDAGPFDKHFDVPFSTLSTNQINGGIAVNTIPEECQFYFEFRQLPSVSVQPIINRIQSYGKELLTQMQKESQDARFDMQMLANAPSFAADMKAKITQLTCELTKTTELLKVAYATEAGLFQAVSIPTVVCGPGSITEAHRANEWVALDQLKLCEEYLHQVVQQI